ncbi:hypothetical protein P171DRAFT_437226 [Karstenula rhodostoma CBS 690.94]|uniref:Uncharacterized protein n=1 Tax=Karstenula rhodostoma CBS 690.94 TaxID=1392251 RepID=A0A9P4P6A8_9PLEO|nr:hypothetical protein P171DRAFT_437226 [Karstenula rhodostoma CBS 690.94]
MSSPAPRPGVTHIPAICPSSSILQRLLREINDSGAPRSDPTFSTNNGSRSGDGSLGSSRRASLYPSIVQPEPRRYSVWAKGGSAAEDARQKLRALDEARLRKPSIIAAQFDNATAPPSAIGSRKTSAALPSLPFFTEIQYNSAAIFPMNGSTSPTSERAINFSGGKRERSGAYSPEFLSKKLRQESFPDMTCRDPEYYSPNHTPDDMTSGDGSVVTTRVQSATLDDPVFRLEPLSEAPSTPPSPPYGFRSTPKHAYKTFRPATPHRSPTPSESGSPGGTPPWARPLHLVEDDISIYKNVHGDKPHKSPLCLYCFRQHGEFHRVINHRCEMCGQNEVLEGHYWEASCWT